MIKVLHIFGKMELGGAEIRTIELMPLMAPKGVRFDYCTLTPGEGTLDQKIRRYGGNVYPCPLRPGLLSFGRRFVGFLKQSDYDIVHSHVHLASGYFVRLAYRAGIKGRIVHFRSTSAGKKNTPKRIVYNKIMRRLVDKYATTILSVSRCTMEFGWGKNWASDKRTKVIYNGFDLRPYQKSYDKESVLDSLGVPAEHYIFIFVARLTPLKAHSILLNSAAKILAKNRKVSFLIVGDGPMRAELQFLAKELRIDKNIHFLGGRKDIPRLLKVSDCFVSPSLREGLPGGILEAVAAKLPIVATDLPSVREISEYTSVIDVVPVGNVDALAEKLIEKIGESGDPARKQPFPKIFELDNCAQTLFNIYAMQIQH